MTSHTELVAIRVAEVGPVVVGVILGPQTGLTFAGAATRKRQGRDADHDV